MDWSFLVAMILAVAVIAFPALLWALDSKGIYRTPGGKKKKGAGRVEHSGKMGGAV